MTTTEQQLADFSKLDCRAAVTDGDRPTVTRVTRGHPVVRTDVLVPIGTYGSHLSFDFGSRASQAEVKSPPHQHVEHVSQT